MLPKIAAACNAILFLLLTFFIVTKGMPNKGSDIFLVLLVYASTVTSFLSLNPFKKK